MANPDEGSYDEVTRLIEKLNQPDPEATIKKGSKVKFFDVSTENPVGCWMEGYVGQRITKLSQAKASNYMSNFYNIEGITLILNLWNIPRERERERDLFSDEMNNNSLIHTTNKLTCLNYVRLLA